MIDPSETQEAADPSKIPKMFNHADVTETDAGEGYSYQAIYGAAQRWGRTDLHWRIKKAY